MTLLANNHDDNSKGKRISVSSARSMLGMVGRNYSDEDLETLLDHLYGIAGTAFETYLDTAVSPNELRPPDDADLTE